jgi:hypothetical protein
MAGRTSCLHFMLPDGEDIYLYPISELLSAMNRKRRDTILLLEKKGIFPLAYTIFVQTKKHQAERYYTKRTIDKMRKWFLNNPQYADGRAFTTDNKSWRKPGIHGTRIKRIQDLFKEEFEKFQGAHFVGRLSPGMIARIPLEREKAESNAETIRFIGDEEPGFLQQIEAERNRTDWSH